MTTLLASITTFVGIEVPNILDKESLSSSKIGKESPNSWTHS